MNIFLLVILYFYVVVVVLQFLYYTIIFGQFSFAKMSEKKITFSNPISVIVCAKNEEQNLKKLIPLLLNQDYTDFEIILIDDASSDQTLDILEDFEKLATNIKLVKVKNNEAFWGNKKFALTLGIKKATKNHLLFIDADCEPNSINWITEMTKQFSEQKTIVLGYGGYKKEVGFLNKLIRFETLLTATQYFGWAKIGKPYMGVGRNLAYKKEEFFKTNGFINHIKIRSGDDDLFINEAANSQNTTIAYSADCFTYSDAKETLSDWIMQKRRHISTAKHYKPFDKIQLTIFFITQLLTLILPTILLCNSFQYIIVLPLVAFRYIFCWISLGFASKKLLEKDVILYYPILEIMLIITQINVFVQNIFSKPVTWK